MLLTGRGKGVGWNLERRLVLWDSEEALLQLDLPHRVCWDGTQNYGQSTQFRVVSGYTCVEGDGVEETPVGPGPDLLGTFGHF